MTEKMFGELISSATGLTPLMNACGAVPVARTARPNSRVTTIAARKP